MKNILINLTIAIVSSAFTFMLFHSVYSSQAKEVPTIASPAMLANYKEVPINTKPRAWAADNPSPNFVTTSKKVTAAVANINTLNASGYRISSGSGVVISSDGYIITNHHVIEDGSTFEVTLHDKRKLEAELIGSDQTTDLALLKTNARDLKPISYGDSDQVEIGEWVLAVGNPFNLTSTVTAGIISAKARNINILRGSYSIESFIQTDAVVNPGNSGGALVNDQGELIGINTAIISESGGYEGYSFAIPSNLVRKVIRDIREFGEVQRAVLGIGILEVSNELAAQLELPNVAGVYVTNVSSGSSAAEAGIRKGDVIVSINDTKTSSVPELQEQVALFRPSDRISIEYYRNGRKYKRDNVILKGLNDFNYSSRR
jgi:serine protease Do